MTKCKFKKAAPFVVAGVLTLAVVGGFIYKGVGANPDYICVKDVVNQPCNVDPATCTSWDSTGKRTCNGTTTTKVAYFLRRTSCEPGYTRIANGSSNGSSDRQTADYTYESASCTIVQQDNVAPVGSTGNN